MKLGFAAGTLEVDRFGGERAECNIAFTKRKEHGNPYLLCSWQGSCGKWEGALFIWPQVVAAERSGLLPDNSAGYFFESNNLMIADFSHKMYFSCRIRTRIDKCGLRNRVGIGVLGTDHLAIDYQKFTARSKQICRK